MLRKIHDLLITGKLKHFLERKAVMNELGEFLAPKKVVDSKIEELRIKARRGDKQAAKDFISMLASMDDGPSPSDIPI